MSKVYINMEMPDRCFSCPMCETDCCGISHGSYIEYRELDIDVAINGRPDWCPIVHVPDQADGKSYANVIERLEMGAGSLKRGNYNDSRRIH